MGTQKNRLDDTVLLSTQNICQNWWVRKYLKFYAENIVYLNLWSLLDSQIILLVRSCTRLYFLFSPFPSFHNDGYLDDIYFLEVNTTHISSSAVKKISIFQKCVERVKMLIFSPHEMKYFWLIFFLFYTQQKYRKHNLTFSAVVSRLISLLQCVYWEWHWV